MKNLEKNNNLKKMERERERERERGLMMKRERENEEEEGEDEMRRMFSLFRWRQGRKEGRRRLDREHNNEEKGRRRNTPQFLFHFIFGICKINKIKINK